MISFTYYFATFCLFGFCFWATSDGVWGSLLAVIWRYMMLGLKLGLAHSRYRLTLCTITSTLNYSFNDLPCHIFAMPYFCHWFLWGLRSGSSLILKLVLFRNSRVIWYKDNSPVHQNNSLCYILIIDMYSFAYCLSNIYSRGQNDSTERCKLLALHVTNFGSVPGCAYGPFPSPGSLLNSELCWLWFYALPSSPQKRALQ